MKKFQSSIQRASCAVMGTMALVVTLTGCAAPFILGGAVVGGVMAVDRRTAGTQIEDEGIELRAASRIRESFGDRVHVNVTSFNRQVLLTGEVPNAQDRQKVEQLMGQVENVLSVVNDLAVMSASGLGQRSNDTFITGKVRASLIEAKDVPASALKVITERNVVYLMGLVTSKEAARATEIARGVSGVTKVVRVLDIISEDERSRLAPKPAPVTTDYHLNASPGG